MKTKTLCLALSATAAATLFAGVARAGDEGGDAESKLRIESRSDGCPRMEVYGLGDAFVMNASQKGFLGVEITNLTPELRSHFGVPDGEGVMIGKVVDDSAAARAGLQVGDILTRVDGESIEGGWKLTSAIRHKGGETVDLEYWRDGGLTQTAVVLDEKESCSFDFSGYVDSLEELGERLPELQLRGLQISEDALEEVMESLQGIDWGEHIKKIERIEIDDLDLRMEDLQIQLEELGERLEREGLNLNREIEKEIEEHHRERIEAEVRIRRELSAAKAEARRARTEQRRRAAEMREEVRMRQREAVRAQVEAQVEARESRREAARAQAAAEAEARALLRDAERAAAEEAEGEGGGDII